MQKEKEIIAAIAAEKDLPLSELFTHMSEQHDLTLTATELADIIQVARKGAPLVEAGEPDWKNVVKIQNESTYTFELVISGVVVGYASKAGLQSKYTFHPAQYLALSAAHLDAISAAIKHYNK